MTGNIPVIPPPYKYHPECASLLDRRLPRRLIPFHMPPGSASRGQIRTPNLGIKLTLVSLLLLMTLIIGRTAPIAPSFLPRAPATKDLAPRSRERGRGAWPVSVSLVNAGARSPR